MRYNQCITVIWRSLKKKRVQRTALTKQNPPKKEAYKNEKTLMDLHL